MRLEKVGPFRSRASKANLDGSCSGLWIHSEPPFSEVCAVLQAVYAPGQCGRDYPVSAGLGLELVGWGAENEPCHADVHTCPCQV